MENANPSSRFFVSFQLTDRRGETAGQVLDALRLVLETAPPLVYCPFRCPSARQGMRCPGHLQPARFALDAVAVVPRAPRPRFTAHGVRVLMDRTEEVTRARSKTMAKRIAHALNQHVPNEEGV